MYRGLMYKMVYAAFGGALPRIPAVGEELELKYHKGINQPSPEDNITYEVIGIKSDYYVIEHDDAHTQLGYSVQVFMRPADKF